MTDLIGRLERALRPDRELDLAIEVWWMMQNGHRSNPAPHFTASIDDALTLVPESAQWSLEADTAWVRWMGKEDVEEAQGGFSGRKCTALALCIAALKARSRGAAK